MRKWLRELRMLLAVIALGIAIGTLASASGNDLWLTFEVFCVSIAVLLIP